MSAVLHGLYGAAPVPLNHLALRKLLLNGAERFANCDDVRLQEIHGNAALADVVIEAFGIGQLWSDGDFQDREKLSDRRTFIRCVRWMEEARTLGCRTLVLGPLTHTRPVLLALHARHLGSVEAAIENLGLASIDENERAAAGWALGLP